MKARCLNPKDKSYYRYGGRGIQVCERWKVFENFRDDMGGRPAGTSLDRIDNDGHYEPANCRWADLKTQARNKRTNVYVELNGEKRTLVEWCEILGLDYGRVQGKRKLGMSPAEALRA